MKHLALLLILLTTSLDAGERSACVRVIGVAQRCGPLGCTIQSTAFGSAVIVGKFRGQWAALTCEHVTRGCVRVDVQIDGARLPVEQVAYDRSVDLALIVFEHAGELDWSRIADKSPEPGAAVVASGYPGGGIQYVRAARVTGKNFADLVSFVPAPVGGDSGGGLFRDGQLVATISAADKSQGYAVPAATIHAFFARKNIQLQIPERYSRPVDPPIKDAPKPEQPDIAQPEETPVDPPVQDPQPPEQPPSAGAHREEPTDSQQEAAQNDSAGIPWGAIVSTGAAALGLGTPVGAGIAVAGWLAGRIRRKRRVSNSITRNSDRLSQLSQRLSDSEAEVRKHFRDTTEKVVPVPVDSPPPPQQVVTETHFSHIETNSHSEARAWAAEQLARKYPGSVDLLEAEQALIKQYLAAMPQKTS